MEACSVAKIQYIYRKTGKGFNRKTQHVIAPELLDKQNKIIHLVYEDATVINIEISKGEAWRTYYIESAPIFIDNNDIIQVFNLFDSNHYHGFIRFNCDKIVLK
jgi:hypothetical protein